MHTTNECIIDAIVSRKTRAAIVYESTEYIAFLDHRPLFVGHTLLAPKTHHPTIYDLPQDLALSFTTTIKMLGRAIEIAMQAQGSFIAINNKVSQSISHLHVHIVPRNQGDGLKGFFWPRTKYKDDSEMQITRDKIVNALQQLDPFN